MGELGWEGRVEVGEVGLGRVGVGGVELGRESRWSGAG